MSTARDGASACKRPSWIGRALVLVGGGIAAACGSGTLSDGAQMRLGAGPLQADFDSIQANVLTPRCTACHVGATAPLGLRLDEANSYALLVGIASVQEPGLLRVDPGDPDASYLIRKLEGSAGSGGQMPLGEPPLAQAEIDVIRQWIADGAQRSPAPAVDPVRVTSLSPLPGEMVPMLPMSVMAVFDRELNANTVDATTFRIERSGGDGTFNDGNEVAIVPVSVTVPLANPLTAVLDMSTAAPVEDTYRVTLAGSGAVTIQDLDANALDGEFGGAFPSGDGTAGGDFVAEFAVVGIQPTLQSIQDNVFTPICSGCHTGPVSTNLPSGLDLTSLTPSYLGLVGVASLEDGTLQRVRAGDADASYLVRKLEGTQTAGSRMPPFGPALEQTTIDAIRQWITDGAQM